MTSEEDLLGRVFRDTTPALPQPADRVAAVGARVRRTRRLATAAALTTTAAAIALVVGVPAVLSGPDGSRDTDVNTAASAPAALTAGCANSGAAALDRERIRADRPYWQSRGIKMNTLSVDVTGTVAVGVDPSQAEKAKTEIPPRYDHPVVIEAREAGRLTSG